MHPPPLSTANAREAGGARDGAQIPSSMPLLYSLQSQMTAAISPETYISEGYL